MKRKGLVLVMGIAVILIASVLKGGTIYKFVDLGTLYGGNWSAAYGINDAGQIVGGSGSFWGNYATLFDSSGLGANLNLGSVGIELGGSIAMDINNNNQIVGYGGPPATNWAILFDSSGTGNNINLGDLGGNASRAYAINNNGQIVGEARFSSQDWHATLFDPTGNGNNLDLGTLGGSQSGARAINDFGQIVGSGQRITGEIVGTLFHSTGSSGNTVLGSWGCANSINISGQIVGDSYGRATLFNQADISQNLYLGGFYSEAHAINDRGRIVGYISPTLGDRRAALFDPTGGGANIDLNERAINKPAGWILKEARDINNNGWIVGEGQNPEGQRRAFLLMPPPKTYGLFIGSNDYTLLGLGEIKVNGWEDAALVKSRFEGLYGFADARILNYKAWSIVGEPWADVQAMLDNFTNVIKPGDILVFYYMGHGGGSETDFGVDETLAPTLFGRIKDDDLATWFLDSSRRDKWAGVNKLFILDSCHSGGFWNGEDSDLSGLDKVVLLAAASELNLAYARPEDGRGYFSLALEDGLEKEVSGWARADIGKNGLTVQDLIGWLKDYPAYQNGIAGYLMDGWSDEPVAGQWGFTASASPDFEMVIIPEPATLSLLAVGWLGGFLSFRRHKKEKGHSC